MKDEKHPTEYEPWGTYQTGSTQPPKNYRVFIALLLGLVIFLCSITTALGLMNIKLTRQLASQEETQLCSMAFSDGEPTVGDQPFLSLGFTGQTVSDFWCRYYDLPQGVYITETAEAAAQKGLCAGDILLRLDHIPIADWQSLTDHLSAYSPGESINVTVYRQGRYLQYCLTLTEPQE